MFSIVIPLYNKEAYIGRTIDSVLDQTFSGFELLIVNDGSMDNSLDVAKTFKDKRIKIISQKNSGVSAARNNGIKNASYSFIAFLDADDWWDSNFLLEIKRIIKKYPDAGLYGTNYYNIRHGKLFCNIVINDFYEGYLNYFETYLNNMNSPINSSSCIINKNVINNMYFNEVLKSGEDLDFWIRIACCSKIVYLNEYLTYYNHDVGFDRAINKLFDKENYYVFNLEQFEKYERTDLVLKKLLDNLKIRSLIPYHLNNLYRSDIKRIIRTVNKKNISLIFRMFYLTPSSIVNLFYIYIRRLKYIITYLTQRRKK